MRPVILILLIASTATAQYVIDPARAVKVWASHADDRPLHCEVIPVPARLSFSFRFQTGYVVRMPLKQYTGAGHRWNVLMRITPQGGSEPFYLGSYTRLRTVPKTNAQGEFGGVYQVGEGRYTVDWMLADDQNRVCRKSWKVDAKLDARERGLKLGMAANTVGPLTFRRWSPQSDDSDVRPDRPSHSAVARRTVVSTLHEIQSAGPPVAGQFAGLAIGGIAGAVGTGGGLQSGPAEGTVSSG